MLLLSLLPLLLATAALAHAHLVPAASRARQSDPCGNEKDLEIVYNTCSAAVLPSCVADGVWNSTSQTFHGDRASCGCVEDIFACYIDKDLSADCRVGSPVSCPLVYTGCPASCPSKTDRAFADGNECTAGDYDNIFACVANADTCAGHYDDEYNFDDSTPCSCVENIVDCYVDEVTRACYQSDVIRGGCRDLPSDTCNDACGKLDPAENSGSGAALSLAATGLCLIALL